MICYTDGSAHPNPGPGGYGVVILDDDGELIAFKEYQSESPVTNNEMELSAILFCMRMYGNENAIVYSDSAYAINTLSKWMFGWADKGWVKGDGKVPENLDIIKEYYDLYQKGYRIQLEKVAGHTGNKWNEMADKIAKGVLVCKEIF